MGAATRNSVRSDIALTGSVADALALADDVTNSPGDRLARTVGVAQAALQVTLARITRPVLINGEMGLLTDAGSTGESPIDRRITALAVSAGSIVSVYDLADPEELTGTSLFR